MMLSLLIPAERFDRFSPDLDLSIFTDVPVKFAGAVVGRVTEARVMADGRGLAVDVSLDDEIMPGVIFGIGPKAPAAGMADNSWPGGKNTVG